MLPWDNLLCGQRLPVLHGGKCRLLIPLPCSYSITECLPALCRVHVHLVWFLKDWINNFSLEAEPWFINSLIAILTYCCMLCTAGGTFWAWSTTRTCEDPSDMARWCKVGSGRCQCLPVSQSSSSRPPAKFFGDVENHGHILIQSLNLLLQLHIDMICWVSSSSSKIMHILECIAINWELLKIYNT